jgi:hypothetical protein
VRTRVRGLTTLKTYAVCRRFIVSSYVIAALERVYYSLSRVRGSYPDFRIPPNIGAHRGSAEEQLTMPPQKKSKKNIPAETNQEDHHPPEGNEISFIPEPSNTTDQERRAKLEALMKARAEKTTHIQEQPSE